MKELIDSKILIMALFGAGSAATKEIHEAIRKAAVKKVSQGMPSLIQLAKTLRTRSN